MTYTFEEFTSVPDANGAVAVPRDDLVADLVVVNDRDLVHQLLVARYVHVLALRLVQFVQTHIPKLLV